FMVFVLLVLFLPLHPLALLVFLWYDAEVNTSGHTGYEVAPPIVARHWMFLGFNTVRHHDAHHINTRVSFGSFFNVWDRWMGRFQDFDSSTVPAAKSVSRVQRPKCNRQPSCDTACNGKIIAIQ